MSVKTVNKPSLILAAAMAAALSTAAVAPANAAEMEKCYGVTKAGMNDCKTANGSCAGTAKMDHQKDAFIVVPVGTCAKIAGGTLEPMMK
jgi:uncharacterized membrane protein